MNRPADHDPDTPATTTRRGALVGLIVVLVLAVLAVFLVRGLRKDSAYEDCLMAGRSNCAPVQVPARR